MRASFIPTAGQLLCSSCLPSCGDALQHIALLIDEFSLQFVNSNQFCEACERGVSETYLGFFLSRTAPFWNQVTQAAAKGGHKHVFQWLMTKRSDGRGPWRSDFKSILHELAAHGHLQVLQWMTPQVRMRLTDTVMDRAAANGRLEVVQWLYSEGVGMNSKRAIPEAAGNGQLEMVQWLHGKLALTCWSFSEDNEKRDENENAKIPVSLEECLCYHALDRAVVNDHLDVAKWLHENCKGPCWTSTVALAAGHGHLDMVQWLDKHFGNQFDRRAMDNAAENGHLNVLKWLHEHRSEGCTAQATIGAALNGHLDVIKWLHLIRPETWTTKTMEYAARSGHLDVVQWLFENRPDVRTVKAIDCAAREGHTNVVEWLHRRTGNVCSNRVLGDVVRGLHLEMLCWLEKNTTQRSSGWGFAHADLEVTHFQEALKRGYLEVMLVWLEKTYGLRSSLGPWAKGEMQKCCNKTLNQLSQAGYSFALATERDTTTCDLIKTLDRYHSDGFHMCANVMLQSALEVGYIALVQGFFKKKNDLELEKYVEIAAQFWQWALLRWLLEHGTQLTVNTANLLITHGSNVEVTWWLSETDRVEMVCKAIRLDSSELLLWLLENTTFLQTSSQESIGEAIQDASNGIRHRLMSRLTASSVRDWCFSAGTKAEMEADIPKRSKRARLS